MNLANICFEPAPPRSPRVATAPARMARVPTVDLSPEVRRLLRAALEGAGLDPASYRLEPLARRVPACLRSLGVSSVPEATELVERRPDLSARALDQLLIGSTNLYRDPAVFERLQGLLKAWPGRAPLRVWSAPCSGGDELISLALLLAELGRLDGAELLGTDVRPDALRRARRPLFTPRDLEALPPGLARKYFVPVRDGVLQPSPRIMEALHWRLGDVLAMAPFEGFDLVCCRNLAIYLTEGGARALWRTMAQALAPGGLLVVGRADRPGAGLPLRKVDTCIHERPA